MPEPSPTTTRRFDSTPKAFSPLWTEVTLIRTKATMTEPSLITTRQFDSIPIALSPSATEASVMQKRATLSTGVAKTSADIIVS
jgi:hypothetical protein